ncbi:MAG: DUF4118 domain-containing protein [Lachnospiraceae bacterium]|nr:DUF4118 domain-containing protein [Lachnospiraceae bacterium]
MNQRIKDLFKTAGVLLLATYASTFILNWTGIENNTAMIYVLSVLIISQITNGYLWGVIASVVGTFSINYFFMYPYNTMNFTISGYPVALITMLTVSIVTCTLSTRSKIQAHEAIIREQKTKELYAMNEKLSQERTQIQIESAREKMRSNLLRAISHDLRTPLTTITGAASVILEQDDVSEAERTKLLKDIKEDGEWLIRMVENLLSVTKINNDPAQLKKHPELIDEVISDALIKLKKQYPDTDIIVTLPEEITFVPMDALLIKQVIINLVENAIRHSGNTEGIHVIAMKKEHYMVVTVRDHGKGFSEEDTDSTKGLGIGLPVCESIIQAHGGYFKKTEAPEGGALIEFGLCLEEKGGTDGSK